MFSNPAFDGHERVIYATDDASGLSAIIAIHKTALGPAFGGCRMWPYADEAEALTDVLRLSRGMTHKAAICGLPYGGGKAVILGDPATQKTTGVLRAMGRVVESLHGQYIIADDVGIVLSDLAMMREETSHTAAATASAQVPLGVTGYGVLMAMEAAVAHRLKCPDLAGLRVAVQGLGTVGRPLCRFLQERGAELVVTDIDAERAKAVRTELGARGVPPEEIYDQDVDVFAPCAMGAVLTDETIPRLRAPIVCGGANNQLLAPRHDAMLAERGITFVPDYIASAGGVIDFSRERVDDSPEAVLKAVARIREITRDVLSRAAAGSETPQTVADRIVQRRIEAAARAASDTRARGKPADG